MNRTFVLDPENPRWMDVLAFLGRTLREQVKLGNKLVVQLAEPKRNSESNALMWCLLRDLSQQVGWKRARWRGDRCIEDGAYVLLRDHPDATRLSDEDFKDIITATMHKPRLAAGMDGQGVVALGLRTSRMSQRQMGEVIDRAQAWGSQLGVQWNPNPKERAA